MKNKHNLKILKPYLNRMKDPVINRGNMKDLHNFEKIYDNIKIDEEGEIDVLFLDKFPKNFEEHYEKLKKGGMCIFFQTDIKGVQEAILNWRLDKKHCPLIHCIVEDNIWFWYKPFGRADEKIKIKPYMSDNLPITPHNRLTKW